MERSGLKPPQMSDHAAFPQEKRTSIRSKKYGLAAIVASVLTVGLALPASAQAAARYQPILFVHGYTSWPKIWKGEATTARDSFTEWLLYDYPGTKMAFVDYGRGPDGVGQAESNYDTAERVKTKVRELYTNSGNRRVDIVTHSMGMHSTRLALKDTAILAKVKHVVSLGGPNHGAGWCNLLPNPLETIECGEMKRGSALLEDLNGTSTKPRDETPGAETYYLTIKARCDAVVPRWVGLFKGMAPRPVDPEAPIVAASDAAKSRVKGDAVNIQLKPPTPYLDGFQCHVDIPKWETMYKSVKGFLNGAGVKSDY